MFGYQQKNSVLYHLEDLELEFCVGKITWNYSLFTCNYIDLEATFMGYQEV